MAESGKGEITQLLARWEQGESGAIEALAPLVYDQLRAIAEAYLRKERPDHTLQPTAVANEVFVDLLRVRRLALKDRAHFFTFAAQLTRRVLIDSARKAKSEKRGLGWQRAPLDAELAWLGGDSAESLDLSQALNDLAEFDAIKTRMVELHYFLGCTVEETAEILDISTRTVERSLHFSLAWLRRRLA
ncbi:MAG TPA: ECF-type sigma factor [Bryobacteraceae bacterium]|nr:ECF-type sigma factor [Bryobacteraceae bacterium]